MGTYTWLIEVQLFNAIWRMTIKVVNKTTDVGILIAVAEVVIGRLPSTIKRYY